MDEYINASDLREKINSIREKDYIYLKSAYIDGLEQRADTVLDFIDEMVSANGIKIIHCKDCMYSKTYDDGDIICQKTYQEKMTNADDFCSSGERKNSNA